MVRSRVGWTLTVKVWLGHDGDKVLGPGRAELLDLIDRHRSISAAARLMNMSYRRAWSLVRSTNTAAGVPLVAAVKGGSGGGGAELTPAGKTALAWYHTLVDRLTAAAARSPRPPFPDA
jgi:molybdate transport system regulatory protein